MLLLVGLILMLQLHHPCIKQGAPKVQLVEGTPLWAPADSRSINALLLCGCGLCHTAAALLHAAVRCQLCSHLLSHQEGCVVGLLEAGALCVQHLLVARGIGCHARMLQQLLHTGHVSLRTCMSQRQREWLVGVCACRHAATEHGKECECSRATRETGPTEICKGSRKQDTQSSAHLLPGRQETDEQVCQLWVNVPDVIVDGGLEVKAGNRLDLGCVAGERVEEVRVAHAVDGLWQVAPAAPQASVGRHTAGAGRGADAGTGRAWGACEGVNRKLYKVLERPTSNTFTAAMQALE